MSYQQSPEINIPRVFVTPCPVQWSSFAVFFSHTFHNTMTNILLHVALIQTSDYSVEIWFTASVLFPMPQKHPFRGKHRNIIGLLIGPKTIILPVIFAFHLQLLYNPTRSAQAMRGLGLNNLCFKKLLSEIVCFSGALHASFPFCSLIFSKTYADRSCFTVTDTIGHL